MRDAINFVGFWRPPPPHCLPPLTPQYLTILMTVRGGATIFCRIPPPDATILNYLNDMEGGAPLSFVGFWRLPMTPPPPDDTILNYLNDRERWGGIIIL